MLPNFTYVRPGSLDAAIRELSTPDTHLHAGGTDLLGCLRNGIVPAKKLVSLSGLKELRGIAEAPGGGWRIGALTPLAEVAAHPALAKSCAALTQAAGSVASPQLRNQGTLGGNLCQRPRCWYFRSSDFHCLRKGGDTCFAAEGENEYHCIFGGSGCVMVHPSDTAPALIALEARVRIAGPKGPRTVPLASFFAGPIDELTKETVLAPGEILTEILVPASPANLRSFYRKARVRAAWDFALAGAAVALRVTDGRIEWARVVLAAVAPVPWRSAEAEKALVGKPLNAQTIAQAAAAAVKGAEPLSQNAYKVDLVEGIVEEALSALV
ncbi:MAG TPA: xanthine dehydrogenase family protein subunit M [Bryobacteraceae bacterium]|nr:xanthine dehydrogenase family protein subunit M [Bryobacteraceae bacterium]